MQSNQSVQPPAKSQFARDLKDKDPVATSFLVKFSAVAVDKNGKPYMNLILMDKTGDVEAKLWENVPSHMGQVVRDAFVWVEGRCQFYQTRKQVVINKIQILREDEVDVKSFVPEGTLDAEQLYSELLGYVSSMQDPDYQALAKSILIEDSEIVDRIKRAPAAKSVHHAYKTGLLEHMVSVSGLLDSVSKHYGKTLNRDLLLLGGFLHDIGKIWELSYEKVTDYTTEGRLIGHLVMGVELVERKVRELGRAFPEDKKLLAKHMVLAHHGKLEFGSPKEPQCLEALIVHYMDDLDSKVHSIKQFIEQDQTPGKWTSLHRMYDRYFYKGEPKSSGEST